MLKTVLFSLTSQHEGQLYANWLFYIFTIYYKCPLFQFFSHGMCMHFPILTVVQKGRITGSKMATFYLKFVLLKLDFEKEGQLHANWLFYVFRFCYKCLLFQFLSCGIYIHVPILTGVQDVRISPWKKQSYFSKNCSFWCLYSETKVSCMPIACFIFWLFTANAFFFSS